MSLQKILNLDIKDIAKFFIDKKSTKDNCTVPEELQGLLNNGDKNVRPLVDSTVKNIPARRIDDAKVQAAIKKFNNLTLEEKTKILNLADSKLHEKLLTFINRNDGYKNTSKNTMEAFNKLTERVAYIREREAYDMNEMDEFWNEFDTIIKQCQKSVDYVTETFVQYRGHDLLENKNIPLTDKAKYAISKSSNMKQTVTSYGKIVKSKLRKLHQATVGKDNLMQEIVSTIARLQTTLRTFQQDSAEIMNNYISEAVLNDETFSKEVDYYANNGIEENFSIENKVIENAILDAVMERLYYRGATLN